MVVAFNLVGLRLVWIINCPETFGTLSRCGERVHIGREEGLGGWLGV
jgi:hypothetical protein